MPPAPQVPQAPQQPIPHILPLNWSHFKPKFSGKQDKHAETHLLRMNDWMDNDKVQRFSLTLTGEARLWYESLRVINIDWIELQNSFRQQYSKIGNTRELLFQVWKSFYFDDNTETIHAYIHHIRQVTTLLGYKEPQILEVSKNTYPTRLYWVIFPLVDICQAVEIAKRILTKEKIDRQLVGQSSSTAFMKM